MASVNSAPTSAELVTIENLLTTWLHNHDFNIVHVELLKIRNGFRMPGPLLHLDKKNINMLFKSVAALQDVPFFARMKFTALTFWVQERDWKGVDLSCLILAKFTGEVLTDFMHKVKIQSLPFNPARKIFLNLKSGTGKLLPGRLKKASITRISLTYVIPRAYPLHK